MPDGKYPAIKETVIVQEEGLIEVRSPELKLGMSVEVIILLDIPVRDEEIQDVMLYSLSAAEQSLGEE